MRLVARHIGKHIPGKPGTVAQNMVGATGLLMANHLANVAPRDGSVIGLVQNGLPSYQAMGIHGVNFDATKFNWIGSLSPTAETMTIHKRAKLTSIEGARTKDLIAGAVGRSGISYTFPKLMNELLGTRFRIITGYQSVNEINIAMERGEADGRNSSWTSWKASKPDWIAKKEINIILYAGPKPRDLDGVPALEELFQIKMTFNLCAWSSAVPVLGTPSLRHRVCLKSALRLYVTPFPRWSRILSTSRRYSPPGLSLTQSGGRSCRAPSMI